MSNPSPQSDNKARLPTDAKPFHYDILIKTDLEKLEFYGAVSAHLDIESDTKSLTFNSSNISITNVSVTYPDVGIQHVDLNSLTFDEDLEQASLALSTALKKGSKAVLSIQYKRSMTNELKGLFLLSVFDSESLSERLPVHLIGYYYSTYEIKGQKRHYGVTQFEVTIRLIVRINGSILNSSTLKATAARHAFPCWDEPALKATFEVSMISKEDTVNLSNMPAVSEAKLASSPGAHFFEDCNAGGWKITKFERTPKMSTYLVALANGDFKHLESSYVSPLSGKTRPLRIYATEDCIHQAQFSLDVKAKALIQYEQAFDIEFALPKLDTLVVHDFDAGAMENWGLITGRTTALLVDPERTDLNSKQNIAGTQSHEVAHMWFGNIATMQWWDNLWLNEGFATLMGEVVILNKLFPEWNVYSSFYNSHTVSALDLDARLSSHPIQVDVPNAAQIGQVTILHHSFTCQFYNTLHRYLMLYPILRPRQASYFSTLYTGEEKFLRGVSIYLKNHLYGNTVADDLWAGIQKATGLDIPTLMSNWTLKIGYPVLTVKETEGGIHIRQDRFLITGKAEEKDNETIWQVPLRIKTVNPKGEASIEDQALLTTRETTYKLDIKNLYKLNAGGTGFYRVLYTPEHLAKLGKEAARAGSTLTTEDRLSLLNDATTLATSGYSTTSSVLTLIDNLKESETEYLVWRGMTNQVRSITLSRSDQADEDDLRDFLRTAVAPLSRKMGYEYPPGEHPDTVQLRTTAIGTAASTGLTEAVRKLQEWFQIYLDTGSDSHIPADLVRPTFRTATKYGGRPEWEEMKKVFINPPNPAAQISAVIAMCNTRDPVLIEENFDFILNGAPNHVKYMVLYFFFGICYNEKIGKGLLSFFKTNYTEITKKMEGTFQLSYVLEAISDVLRTNEDAQELEDFFKDKDTSKINQSLAQALDLIRAKAAWSERSKDDVKNWLQEWKKNNHVEEGLVSN
ncbi:hypothetical protein Clacol_004460 [Clathrus columnatus]|uniref:Aminopeptidase n=1 Tax=Clathrus columnatus TaxID=1419009 RepID=A0AAV5AAH9_9AGAM|nr:hypothetical protein Clacol_004460 [Clathrus columnatus]